MATVFWLAAWLAAHPPNPGWPVLIWKTLARILYLWICRFYRYRSVDSIGIGIDLSACTEGVISAGWLAAHARDFSKINLSQKNTKNCLE
jgi:hypothetical protein